MYGTVKGISQATISVICTSQATFTPQATMSVITRYIYRILGSAHAPHPLTLFTHSQVSVRVKRHSQCLIEMRTRCQNIIIVAILCTDARHVSHKTCCIDLVGKHTHKCYHYWKQVNTCWALRRRYFVTELA